MLGISCRQKIKKDKMSIRQASEEDSVVDVIKSSDELKSAIESMFRHSGGHKKIYPIIRYLRDKLGKYKVSYTDEELITYLNSVKEQFLTDTLKDTDHNIGLVGLEEEYEDNAADYVEHGR